MADYFYNTLTITAERPVLEVMRGYINADNLWAAEEELPADAIEEELDDLTYRYSSKSRKSIDCLIDIARRFPAAEMTLFFDNPNEQCSGYVDFANGKML